MKASLAEMSGFCASLGRTRHAVYRNHDLAEAVGIDCFRKKDWHRFSSYHVVYWIENRQFARERAEAPSAGLSRP